MSTIIPKFGKIERVKIIPHADNDAVDINRKENYHGST